MTHTSLLSGRWVRPRPCNNDLLVDVGVEMSDALADFFARQRAEHEARVERQLALVSSKEYQDELKFIRRVCNDFLNVLRLCVAYSGRASEFSENSLVVRSSEDLRQSVMAAWSLAEDGLMHPVRRELRYVLESAVKHLFVDQQMLTRRPTPSLTQRLDFLQQNVGHSLDEVEHLQLEAFHQDDAKQFKSEVYDAYRDCCAYVHVSRRQIDERLALIEKGHSLGFESVEQVRQIGRLMFRVFDMALALYFHGYALPMSGDIFIEVLDDQPKWKFHKGRYVGIVSAFFDYKHERNMRKYGEPRPWNPSGWPPKRL